ncbi:DUF4280 domain-containing protein [Flavobacterium columnare]|uniref:DUF4280 domain-containing protein n=1 Tax=Flavobacterium columnare TaxID=996 RepID=A0A437U895_9FLAO|nr:DUF4280 domain-containing protein [Flavobacterium columnare]RVU89850.1 DUF4280 domain-containing protein [Flavobacterium columnare]
MPQKLTENGLLVCNKGTKPSQLKVTSQTFSRVEGKLIATEEDKHPETNILSFGVCTITNNKCTPTITKWENTTEKDSINNCKILTEESTCQCFIGGKISVEHKGYEGQHEMI